MKPRHHRALQRWTDRYTRWRERDDIKGALAAWFASARMRALLHKRSRFY